MDYNEKVEYLKSYRDKCDRIAFIDNQMMGIKAINYGPSLGGHKTISQYMAEKQGLMNEMEEIESAIDTVSNEKARLVLGYRFLQFHSLNETSKLINYSYSQTKRFYKEGIKLIEI